MQNGSETVSEQLRLFEGGIDMVTLRRLRDDLKVPRRSHATISAYASDWNHFQKWCAEAGLPSLPTSSKTLELYITSILMQQNKRVSTAARRIASIKHFHRQAKEPLPDAAESRHAIASVRRDRREHPNGKTALHPSELFTLAEDCDIETNLGIRNRALFLLGFATSLRRSDIARLNLADVAFKDDRMVVGVTHSKTDQDGRGRLVPVWPGKNPVTDPVASIRRWIEVRGDWDGPLFCRVKLADGAVIRRAIRGTTVCELLQKAVESIGLNSRRYGAHSLRAGSITAAAELGCSDQEIMGLSGHATAAMMQMYIRRGRLFSGRNPLEGAL